MYRKYTHRVNMTVKIVYTKRGAGSWVVSDPLDPSLSTLFSPLPQKDIAL
tara:strand:+ start:714 stop:863 length:150 start_codon:yes stop_codon:yes gene_type:complete